MTIAKRYSPMSLILGAFVFSTGPVTMLGASDEAADTTGDSACEEVKRTVVVQTGSGRSKEAEALLSAALADGKRKCVGLVLTDLASIAFVSGQIAQAQQFAERSIKVLQMDHASNDPILLRPLHTVSAASFEQGKLAKSRRTLHQMLQIRAERPDDRTLVHSTAAMLLRYEGKLREAETEVLMAIRAWEETGLTNGADYAALVGGLGGLYIEQRRHADARPVLDRALAIAELAADATPMDRIQLLHIRAALHARDGEWRESEEKFVKALAMAEQESRADPIQLRALLTNYASLLRKTHRGREARSFEKRAAALRGYPATNALVDVTELLREARPRKR
jgi:tetratricopeptide (TPR) repeat protein